MARRRVRSRAGRSTAASGLVRKPRIAVTIAKWVGLTYGILLFLALTMKFPLVSGLVIWAAVTAFCFKLVSKRAGIFVLMLVPAIFLAYPLASVSSIATLLALPVALLAALVIFVQGLAPGK